MTNTAKTLDDFRSVHDKNYLVPQKIKEGLEKLSPTGWEYESDFIKMCVTNNNDFAKFRGQFADFLVIIKQDGRERRVWAGSKALAAKMRDML